MLHRALVVVVALSVFICSDATAQQSDEEKIRTQLGRWRKLWSQPGNENRFSFEEYEDLFVPDVASKNDLLTFDSYVPKWATTQINGFRDYKAVWTRDVPRSFPGWRITRMDVIRVDVSKSQDLAWSALSFWGEGKFENGKVYQGSQHGTHVWRKHGDQWRIAHEHLTAPIVVHGTQNATIDTTADTKPNLKDALIGQTKSDRDVVRELTRKWVSRWRTSTDKPFRLADISELYVDSEELFSFDFGRPHDGVSGWAAASKYYAEFMKLPKSWRLHANDDMRVSINGDVAWSTLSLRASGVGPSDEVLNFPESRVTLIFERQSSGSWLIIHEHGSSALPFPDKETTMRLLKGRK